MSDGSGWSDKSPETGLLATSRKSEMKLTNVARARLGDELLRDFKSFLMQGGMCARPGGTLRASRLRPWAQPPSAGRPASVVHSTEVVRGGDPWAAHQIIGCSFSGL